MTWQQLFFSYQGRINRAKYWLAALVYILVSLVAFGLAFVIFSNRSAIPLAVILAVIIYILFIISGFSVAAKRLHDRNKSGWWILIFYVLPGVLEGGGRASGSYSENQILSLIGFAISVWAFVELGCLRGTVGPNRFGPDPLG